MPTKSSTKAARAEASRSAGDLETAAKEAVRSLSRANVKAVDALSRSKKVEKAIQLPKESHAELDGARRGRR